MAFGKLIWKAIVVLGALVGLLHIYLLNASKTKRAMKFGNRVATDPHFALTLSQDLNSLIMEFDCDHETVHDKLSRLRYELDVFLHRVIKCHPLNTNTFLLVTTYEHADASSSHDVGSIIMLTYKVVLSKETNMVKVYSDALPSAAATEFKRSFVKGLFRQYVGVYVE